MHTLSLAKIASVAILVLLPAFARATPVVLDDTFHASGQGNMTTIGNILANSTALEVASEAAWRVGHGVRVTRAGAMKVVADDEDDFFGGAAGGQVAYNSNDKKQGNHSVVCGEATRNGEVMCQHIVPTPTNNPFDQEYDDLHVWVKTGVATLRGQLRLEMQSEPDPTIYPTVSTSQTALIDGISVVQMWLPELPADTWQEFYLPVKARLGSGYSGKPITRLALRCMADCISLEVQLDDLRLHRDLITTVTGVQAGPPTVLTLADPALTSTQVGGDLVYHDDTVAVRNWLATAPGTPHYAPAGIYYLSRLSGFTEIFSGTTMTCESNTSTVFKSTGRSATGADVLFDSWAAVLLEAPNNITVEFCGFDVNGWNRLDFFSYALRFIGDLDGQVPAPNTYAPASKITVRYNLFFDSVIDANPTLATEDCDLNQDRCATRQRHAVSVRYVDGAWIYGNEMRSGGRIFAGGPGRDILVTNNTLNFVNDNGITVVNKCEDNSAVGCLTENLTITNNLIHNAISSGIAFGSDGTESDHADMEIRNFLIQNNVITGYTHRAIFGALPAGGASDVIISGNTVAISRPRPNVGFTAGISLTRGNAHPKLGTSNIQVYRNSVTSVAPHGRMTLGGISVFGPAEDIFLTGNRITCEDCAAECGSRMEAGISLGGNQTLIDGIDVRENLVSGACVAIRAGGDLANASFVANQLLGSHWTTLGQLTFVGPSIDAEVYDNFISDGKAWGIHCGLNNTYNLTSPNGNLDIDNIFSGNMSGTVAAACF